MAAARPHPPTWVNLPHEITAMILQKLGTETILVTAMQVCTTWRNICKDPSMWRVVVIPKSWPSDYSRKLCREAVDLSQGQLVEIEIPGDDEMIPYIAKRSPKLRRLQIFWADSELSKSISEAVKNFPLLEEIYFLYTNLDVQTILDIATWCPLLTSLSLHAHRHQGMRYPRYSNLMAFAISTMPQLLHLQLVRSWMTNKGLTAILDGCSQLESLDLRKCCILKLGGELGQRCRQQIKHLKLPKDSTEIDEFSEYTDGESFSESESESESESDDSDGSEEEFMFQDLESESESESDDSDGSEEEFMFQDLESESDDEIDYA